MIHIATYQCGCRFMAASSYGAVTCRARKTLAEYVERGADIESRPFIDAFTRTRDCAAGRNHAGGLSNGLSLECEDCDDLGVIECEECNGDGRHDCSCGNEHYCRECDGAGRWTCDECRSARREVHAIDPNQLPLPFAAGEETKQP